MSTERELILLCRAKIEQLLNWGDSSLWTNSDFELLSDKIFEKTTVRLSISTLKRIWGKVKYDNSPTAATLNALANFLDYASWRDFESENNKNSQPTHEVVEAPIVPTQGTKSRVIRISTMVTIVIASIIVVSLLVKGRSPHRFDPALATFTHREITDDLPNSVVFDYDVSAYHADSAFIQQSWDPMRRDKVSVDGKTHTSVYYQPGYFQAKLIVNDTVIKQDVVWIKTKGWKASLEKNGMQTPIYLPDDAYRVDGKMVFTSETLKEKLGTPVFVNTVSTLNNVEALDDDLSSFDFETSIRNTSTVEESACRWVEVTLLTDGMAIIMPLMTKGCSSEADVLTLNRYISGKENDLSAFGCEFKDFEKFKISLHDSLLTASINDKTIFSEKENHPVGKIVGIRIGFQGAGEVQYVKLNDKLIE
jgi:hypothetical protein